LREMVMEYRFNWPCRADCCNRCCFHRGKAVTAQEVPAWKLAEPCRNDC
jgi:hypothetical protein